MLKISIIEPIGAHGGNDIYDFNLIDSININGVKATLYTCDKTNSRPNVTLVYKKIFGDHNKLLRGMRYIIGTLQSLVLSKIEETDIVHLHFFGFTKLEYLNLYLSKKVFKIKTVATVHDIESFASYANNKHKTNNYNKFFKLLDGIIVHTDYARQELLKYLDKELSVYNFIETIYACDLDYVELEANKINKAMARKKLGLPGKKDIVLFFGQIKKVKGLDILLRALSKCIKSNSNILLVVAGKVWKDNFNIYQEIIDKHDLKQNVELRIGFVKTEDVKYYFNATDLILLPYRKIYNSGVLIRAMSFATPVIASDVGPFQEFIKDGENGYLFKSEDVESLHNKMIYALDKKDLLTNIGINAKNIIRDKFDLQLLGNQYVVFYKKIMEYNDDNTK